ncbi:MAG: sodium:proton antiporter [Candidatus Stahlbacteria bacterium]|nr:sodium:proton antiporter [Candidatus Stahlbacteria bacterium]
MNETIGNLLPVWTVIPFIVLLLSIAILPLTVEHFWEKNHNKAIIAAIISLPVIVIFGLYGDFQPIVHELKEYFSFIVLLASLFIISGGIYLSGDIQGTPCNNLIFLAIGGIIANIFGTTGAAMLLIRPMLRINSQRKYTPHLPIFFIFIVCNIGGCLLPIGDPPLFMGYLRGVPFFWTLRLLPQWSFMMVLILTTFYLFDLHFWRKETIETKELDNLEIEKMGLHGKINLIFITLVLASVIYLSTPIREIGMIVLALLSLLFTPKAVRAKNEFNFAPIVEVAVIFAGIFITMVPALLILEAQAGEIGISLPWHFFWTTGILSSFLDNTPTYITMLSLAQGFFNMPHEIVGVPIKILTAISLGAVFMGANTYIGNGPNFMVKSICEHKKIQIPSFFGYMMWSGSILIPLFIIVTLVFLK